MRKFLIYVFQIFIKVFNFNEFYKLKIWPKKSGKDHKNREKKLQFFGVNDLKI